MFLSSVSALKKSGSVWSRERLSHFPLKGHYREDSLPFVIVLLGGRERQSGAVGSLRFSGKKKKGTTIKGCGDNRHSLLIHKHTHLRIDT